MIHPGKDKYTKDDLELRRVLDMTWMLAFLFDFQALRVLDGSAKSGQALPRRGKLCQMVLDRLNDVLYHTNHVAFPGFGTNGMAS